MKKLIISSTLLTLALSGTQANAIIDTDRLLNEEYLLNSGYSPETIRMINVKRIDPYAPHVVKEEKQNPLTWAKKFWYYVDPAADPATFGTGVIDPNIDRPSKL